MISLSGCAIPVTTPLAPGLSADPPDDALLLNGCPTAPLFPGSRHNANLNLSGVRGRRDRDCWARPSPLPRWCWVFISWGTGRR